MTAAPAVRRFRKRPVTVEMIRWTGGSPDELEAFTWGLFRLVDPCDRAEDTEVTAEVYDKLHSTWIGVRDGQWVVKGVRGELYPLDDEVRQETYDPAGGLEGKTPGHAVYEAHQAFMIRCFPGIAPIGWDELSVEARGAWEGIAQSGITAGGWDALATEVAEVREVIGNFLGEYGDSEIPMFKVAQDLANSLLKVLDAPAGEVPDA